jgi:hypothetical protein
MCRRTPSLVIVSRRGDMTIAGMTGAVEVNHQRGEVNISDHTGNVALTWIIVRRGWDM